MRHVIDSFEAGSPAGPRGHRGNHGIKVARQRISLEKAAKLHEAKIASGALRVEKQTIQTPCESSVPPCNRSEASKSFSRISSTFPIPAQSKALHQPMIPLPPHSGYAKASTSLTPTNSGVYIQSGSYGRLDSAFQRPLLPLPNNNTSQPSYSMTSRENRVQNDWAVGESLSITISNLPDNITTRELWAAFKHEGHITHIRLCENARGCRDGKAHVKFRYVKMSTFKLA